MNLDFLPLDCRLHILFSFIILITISLFLKRLRFVNSLTLAIYATLFIGILKEVSDFSYGMLINYKVTVIELLMESLKDLSCDIIGISFGVTIYRGVQIIRKFFWR